MTYKQLKLQAEKKATLGFSNIVFLCLQRTALRHYVHLSTSKYEVMQYERHKY